MQNTKRFATRLPRIVFSYESAGVIQVRRKRWRRRNEGIQYSRKSIRVTGNVAKRKQRRKEKHGFVRKRTTEDVCISKEKKKKKKKKDIFIKEKEIKDIPRAQNEAKADSLVCVPLSPPQDIVVLDRIFFLSLPLFLDFLCFLSRALSLSPLLSSSSSLYFSYLYLCSLFFVRLYVLCFFSSTTRSRLNHI